MTKAFENIQLELKETISRLGCIEVVAASSRHGDVRFLCRVTNENEWLQVLNEFLRREVQSGWYSFIGKKYFIHENRLSYGWVLIFESDELDAAVLSIRKMLSEIKESVIGDALEEQDEEIPVNWSSGYYNRLMERRATGTQ
jgi:hypothetical protein